ANSMQLVVGSIEGRDDGPATIRLPSCKWKASVSYFDLQKSTLLADRGLLHDGHDRVVCPSPMPVRSTVLVVADVRLMYLRKEREARRPLERATGHGRSTDDA